MSKLEKSTSASIDETPQRKRVREFSNKIYDIFVRDGATILEMRMTLSEVQNLINSNAKAAPIELLG